jgi:GNAT superfamily N-acetyltransferase
MLYDALYVPPESPPLPRSVLTSLELARYVRGFGTRIGDTGVVAEALGHPAGAAWVRLLTGSQTGYGYVDGQTPELTVAVSLAWRGRGLGTAMVSALVEQVPRMSLSCDTRNPAMRLYASLGFTAVHERDTSVTMLRAGSCGHPSCPAGTDPHIAGPASDGQPRPATLPVLGPDGG